MLRSLFGKSLHDRRRSLLGWTIAIVALAFVTGAFFPMLSGNPEFENIMDELPEGLRIFVGENSLTQPPGYLESRLFQYLIPLLFMIFGIGQAADSIAGEESRKTMDLLLANPITRRRVVIEKGLAVAAGIGWLTLVLIVSLWINTRLFEMDIGLAQISAASIGSALLSLAFAGLALLISGATGKKGLAIAVPAALATASYFLYSLAPLLGDLEDARKFSPFHAYIGMDPLVKGFAPIALLGLALAGVVLALLAASAFNRRDVGT